MENFDVTGMLPANFADNSRVWIYQSTRPFNEQQNAEIDEQLDQFVSQWHAHGAPVKGFGKLFFGRFIVLMADESQEPVSGCSTDSSVRIIKSIERQYDCNLFDRLSITFLKNGKPEVLPMNQIGYALEKGFITPETPLFNNLVATKKEMEQQWLQPLKDSWLAPRLSLNSSN